MGMAVYTFMVLELAALLSPAAAQNCGCQAGVCCSQYGYCGTTYDHCGPGCQAGPYRRRQPRRWCGQHCHSVAFFNGIKSQSSSGCAGQSFYTRQAFLRAAGSYSNFGSGSSDAAKREMAAFFAHVTHETGHFCYIEEINGASNKYCDAGYPQWPCYPGATWRGPLQISYSYNYNYGAAGKSIGFDGLKNPQTVAQNPELAFKTALWFWTNNVLGVLSQGFGATIKAINGAVECNGKNTAEMNDRVSLYQKYCGQLGVDPGGNLTC